MFNLSAAARLIRPYHQKIFAEKKAHYETLKKQWSPMIDVEPAIIKMSKTDGWLEKEHEDRRKAVIDEIKWTYREQGRRRRQNDAPDMKRNLIELHAFESLMDSTSQSSLCAFSQTA